MHFHRKLCLIHLSALVCDHGKRVLSCWLNIKTLTCFRKQLQLKTEISLCFTAITPKVVVLHLIDADGVVPPRALVGKGFHPTTFRVHELNTAFGWEINEDHQRGACPWHPVEACIWKRARKKRGGAEWSDERLRFTKTGILKKLIALLILGREESDTRRSSDQTPVNIYRFSSNELSAQRLDLLTNWATIQNNHNKQIISETLRWHLPTKSKSLVQYYKINQ